MAESRFSRISQISQHSPDHDYFPTSIFRRSKADTETLPSPISERAAGKARAQPSTPLIQSQTQTPTSPAFPSPVHPQAQQPQHCYQPLIQHQTSDFEIQIPNQTDDHTRAPQRQTLLSDIPLNDHAHTNSKHYSYATSSFSPEIKTAEQADHEARQHGMVRARKLQKIDKYTGYVLGLISLSLATMMDGILAYVLHTFYKTKDIPGPDRSGPWAVGTQLWPAYMLLTASTVTWVVDGATLVAACVALRQQRKRRSEEVEGKIGAARAESALVKAGYVAFVAKWFTIATLYRTGKTTKDLWGWSCDTRAANIQRYYVDDLNFATLCRVQTAAWAMSISEMILKALLMGFIFWLGHKLKKFRQAKQAEIKGGKMVDFDEEQEPEPKMGLQRPPSVLWYSMIEAAKMLGQSGK